MLGGGWLDKLWFVWLDNPNEEKQKSNTEDLNKKTFFPSLNLIFPSLKVFFSNKTLMEDGKLRSYQASLASLDFIPWP